MEGEFSRRGLHIDVVDALKVVSEAELGVPFRLQDLVDFQVD